MEFLTTSSVMEQCFYKWMPVIVCIVKADEDVHARGASTEGMRCTFLLQVHAIPLKGETFTVNAVIEDLTKT